VGDSVSTAWKQLLVRGRTARTIIVGMFADDTKAEVGLGRRFRQVRSRHVRIENPRELAPEESSIDGW
jgi:hypothetical protein